MGKRITPDCVYTTDPALDNQKSIKRTYTKRRTIVQIIGTANGVNTYRVRLDNGRTYLYTDGLPFAQVKLPGGELSDTVSQYTLRRIRDAIRQA